MPELPGILAFVVENSPESVLVYDDSRRIVYQNTSATRFLARFQFPAEVSALMARLFDAIVLDKVAELFPGQILFSKEIEGRRLVFRIAHRGGDAPLVCVFFLDETITAHVDVNALRQQYRLTRRETDTLRHLLDGLDNKAISEELGISVQTAKEYVSGIYRKMGVQDRFSLLRHLVGAPQR